MLKTLALALALAITIVPAGAVLAQDADLATAREAVAATKATDSFDAILINASTQLKNQLTAANPDKADLISATVDEEAIALAARRGDLENEAARLFKTAFTEEEMREITAFYSSATGQKYLREVPILGRGLNEAARVWANGVTRDLQENVSKKLAAQSGN